MASLTFLTLDVFTTTRFKGNPLAVCLIPPGVDPTDDDLQLIAREFNLSETVFIYTTPPQTCPVPEFRIRIFMTSAELPFAGHPTIGAAWYALTVLAARSGAPSAKKARLLCNAGPIDVELDDTTDIPPAGAAPKAKALIPHDYHLHGVEAFSIQHALALQPGLEQAQIRAVDVVSPVKGMNFIVVELEDLRALAAVGVIGVRPVAALDRGWDVGFTGSAFYVETGGDEAAEGGGGTTWRYRTRMIEGDFEDPATGSMSCGLAALLALRAGRREAVFEFTQAVEMGRRSEIGVVVVLDADLARVETIEVSGSAVKVMEGTIEY